MRDPNHDHQPNPARLMTVAGLVVTLIGCGIAGALVFLAEGEMPAFIEDGLDLIVMALPDNFGITEAIGWFLVIEGAVWLLAAAVHLAVKLPGIENGPGAEALRERMRANLSAAENTEAQTDLDNLKANAIKRGFWIAFGGLVSWSIAWILLGGIFEF